MFIDGLTIIRGRCIKDLGLKVYIYLVPVILILVWILELLENREDFGESRKLRELKGRGI